MERNLLIEPENRKKDRISAALIDSGSVNRNLPELVVGPRGEMNGLTRLAAIQQDSGYDPAACNYVDRDALRGHQAWSCRKIQVGDDLRRPGCNVRGSRIVVHKDTARLQAQLRCIDGSLVSRQLR